ncbi:hypothetical protein B0O80DRAFT_487333 [Mortierella sp. GBAus27b]|nr:hypothetical protein B0O80DRAFT_487333 [Mortierella sp. GBAus27b]
MNMHFKAANQFLLATNDTQSHDVIQTLKLMSANHARQGKDLQRRVAKAEAAAAAAVPQPRSKAESGHGLSTGTGHLSPSSAGGGGSSSSSSGRRRGSSGYQHQYQHGTNAAAGQHHHHISNLAPGDYGNDSRGGDSGSEDSNLSTSSSDISGSVSSTMIEESFTVIKNQAKDSSDPFYKFWEAVENLVNQISSPVAFTSIPLDGEDPMMSNSPSTDDSLAVNPVEPPFAVQGGSASLANSGIRASSGGGVGVGNPSQPRQSKSRSGVDPSPMHESFFIIDSPSVASSQHMRGHPRSRSESAPKAAVSRRAEAAPKVSTKTLEEYAIENEQLKLTLDKLSRRNMKMEKNLEGLMQMSVWTKDVQRSAMQLMRSQDVLRPNIMQSIMDLSAGAPMPNRAHTAVGTPLPPGSSASSQIITSPDANNPAAMQVRLRELEEEVLKLRLENSKLGASMKKYKQRWEDLKESAKKRRNASSTPPLDKASDVSQYQPSVGINPYSASSLAGNPYSNVSQGQGNPVRPVSSLGRSSSASGPVLSAGGSYQKRIVMESRSSGGLDATSLSMQHRHLTAGIVSSTSPRVLDTSPRTHMTTLPTVSEVPRASAGLGVNTAGPTSLGRAPGSPTQHRPTGSGSTASLSSQSSF